MIEHPDLPAYRPNIGVLLFNRDGSVWLGRRTPPSKGAQDVLTAWQLPQGGMDKGETPEETAFRELYEETGIRSARLLTMTPGWMAYDFPENYTARKGENWRGQRQKWAAMLFDGTDDEVDLAAHEEQEFVEWRWADIDEIADAIIPFKAKLYQELIVAFRPLAVFLRQTSL